MVSSGKDIPRVSQPSTDDRRAANLRPVLSTENGAARDDGRRIRMNVGSPN